MWLGQLVCYKVNQLDEHIAVYKYGEIQKSDTGNPTCISVSLGVRHRYTGNTCYTIQFSLYSSFPLTFHSTTLGMTLWLLSPICTRHGLLPLIPELPVPITCIPARFCTVSRSVMEHILMFRIYNSVLTHIFGRSSTIPIETSKIYSVMEVTRNGRVWQACCYLPSLAPTRLGGNWNFPLSSAPEWFSQFSPGRTHFHRPLEG